MNLFDYIKSRVSILDVVQEYVALKPAGTYWKGYSPFKNERTPSFTVSPHRGIFYCFSTGIGGDVISFIAHMEHCSQIEAAHHLIERYAITLPESLQENSSRKEQTTARLYEKLCSFFATWCHRHLFEHHKALAYTKSRSFSDAIIKQFYIGYCPSGHQFVTDLLTAARKDGLIAQQFIDAHLLSEGSSGLYIPFEDRIIFPIFDLLGRACGFGGRIYQPHDSRPKYYNSREHDFFNKKQLLYGLHLAKKNIQSSGSAYLVEGYIDCIAMMQHGYTNCVATLGTACTQEHLSLLARYAKRVFVMYDGDEAGQKAILRLASLCWKVNMELLVITLPPEHDPASYLSAHKDLQQLPTQPQSIFSFFISRLGKGYHVKSLSEKLSTITQLIETIITIEDPLQRDLILQQAATACDLPVSILKQECRTTRRPSPNAQQQQEISTAQKYPSEDSLEIQTTSLEKKLFSVILSNSIPLAQDEEQFLKEQLSQPLERLYRIFREHDSDFKSFFSSLNEGEQLFVSKLALSLEETANRALFNQLMTQFRQERWKTAIKQAKVLLLAAQEQKDVFATQKALEGLEKAKNILLHKGVK